MCYSCSLYVPLTSIQTGTRDVRNTQPPGMEIDMYLAQDMHKSLTNPRTNHMDMDMHMDMDTTRGAQYSLTRGPSMRAIQAPATWPFWRDSSALEALHRLEVQCSCAVTMPATTHAATGQWSGR